MHSRNTPWKEKLQKIYGLCQHEIKKTTLLGKKMISASRVNTSLNQAYEELGKLAYLSMKNSSLNWGNEDAKELIGLIDQFEMQMHGHEEEIKNIKSSSKSN